MARWLTRLGAGIKLRGRRSLPGCISAARKLGIRLETRDEDGRTGSGQGAATKKETWLEDRRRVSALPALKEGSGAISLCGRGRSAYIQGQRDRNSVSGFKDIPRKAIAGRFVTVKAKEAKHAPMAGQKARVEALRQDRTERLKQALSKASSHSTLFKSAS